MWWLMYVLCMVFGMIRAADNMMLVLVLISHWRTGTQIDLSVLTCR